MGDHVRNVFPPFLSPPPFQSANAHVVLVGAFLVRKTAQLHRLDHTIDHERRTQARPQALEKQLAAPVSPQGLHGRVVDEVDRAPEGGLKVEPDPAWGQVMRFRPRSWMR